MPQEALLLSGWRREITSKSARLRRPLEHQPMGHARLVLQGSVPK